MRTENSQVLLKASNTSSPVFSNPVNTDLSGSESIFYGPEYNNKCPRGDH